MSDPTTGPRERGVDGEMCAACAKYGPPAPPQVCSTCNPTADRIDRAAQHPVVTAMAALILERSDAISERDRYKAALDGIAAALALKPGESHKGFGEACGEDACVPCWLHALAVANGGDDG